MSFLKSCEAVSVRALQEDGTLSLLPAEVPPCGTKDLCICCK